MSTFKDDAAFLDWVADRLVNVYDENPGTDYVRDLRRIASNQRTLAEMESDLTNTAAHLASFSAAFSAKCKG